MDRAWALHRLKGFHEGVLEFVNIGKVLTTVAVGLGKDVVFDQIENDVPEVAAAADPPGVEDRLGERPKLVEGINT